MAPTFKMILLCSSELTNHISRFYFLRHVTGPVPEFFYGLDFLVLFLECDKNINLRAKHQNFLNFSKNFGEQKNYTLNAHVGNYPLPLQIDYEAYVPVLRVEFSHD